jgi:hypothetical protein
MAAETVLRTTDKEEGKEEPREGKKSGREPRIRRSGAARLDASTKSSKKKYKV